MYKKAQPKLNEVFDVFLLKLEKLDKEIQALKTISPEISNQLERFKNTPLKMDLSEFNRNLIANKNLQEKFLEYQKNYTDQLLTETSNQITAFQKENRFRNYFNYFVLFFGISVFLFSFYQRFQYNKIYDENRNLIKDLEIKSKFIKSKKLEKEFFKWENSLNN